MGAKDTDKWVLEQRQAYETSIKEQRCVKFRSGTYFYKGVRIRKEGDGKWYASYLSFDSLGLYPRDTKSELINVIDSELGSLETWA